MGAITARLQRRALLLERWRDACTTLIEHARALDAEAVQDTLAKRSELLQEIMDDHRSYPWSDSERNELRALEDAVEQAMFACHAMLREQVGGGRRRNAAVKRYAEHT